MRRRRRIFVIVAIAAAVLAAVALALRPAPVPAETASVERGPLEVVVEGTGRTRVRERFFVLAPVSGDYISSELSISTMMFGARERVT